MKVVNSNIFNDFQDFPKLKDLGELLKASSGKYVLGLKLADMAFSSIYSTATGKVTTAYLKYCSLTEFEDVLML